MTFQAKVWWVLLVFLTNFPGLIALRVYTLIRRRARRPRPRAVQAHELDRELEREKVRVADLAGSESVSMRSSRWRTVLGWM